METKIPPHFGHDMWDADYGASGTSFPLVVQKSLGKFERDQLPMQNQLLENRKMEER